MTACIYYKLAIERGLRGCDPDGEYRAHGECGEPPTYRQRYSKEYSFGMSSESGVPVFQTNSTYSSTNASSQSAIYGSLFVRKNLENERLAAGLCKNVDDKDLSELIRCS
jgi:hypothetical protein